MAHGLEDLRRAQALRFQVFNVERGEGLQRSWGDGLDADAFDTTCDHLLVEDASGAVVGTYRMQPGARALKGLGLYCETEFDLSPWGMRREQVYELGRACIHPAHRHLRVLTLLWLGIAAAASRAGCRYLIGCSSAPADDPDQAAALDARLKAHWAPEPWRVQPLPAFAWVPSGPAVRPSATVPPLLAAYLSLGACVCGPPALDRDFGTVDFLTWLDLENPLAQAWLQRHQGRRGRGQP